MKNMRRKVMTQDMYYLGFILLAVLVLVLIGGPT